MRFFKCSLLPAKQRPRIVRYNLCPLKAHKCCELLRLIGAGGGSASTTSLYEPLPEAICTYQISNCLCGELIALQEPLAVFICFSGMVAGHVEPLPTLTYSWGHACRTSKPCKAWQRSVKCNFCPLNPGRGSASAVIIPHRVIGAVGKDSTCAATISERLLMVLEVRLAPRKGTS